MKGPAFGLALRLLAFYLYCAALRLGAALRRGRRGLGRFGMAMLACLCAPGFARDYACYGWLRLQLAALRTQRRLWAVWRVEQGFSLPELLVSFTIALLLGIAAMFSALQAQQAFRLLHAQQDVEEGGRLVLEAVARAVRQAGYREFGALPVAPAQAYLQALQGVDRRSGQIRPGLPLAPGELAPGNDALVLRFQGQGDASVRNCAGFGEGVQALPAWSVFYVARSADGETELRCKYQGSHGWGDDAIVRGVDNFQVLYGVDEDDEPDGLSDRFLHADEVAALPDGWRRVRSVRLGLLLHAPDGVQEARAPRRYHLFEDLRDAADSIDEAGMEAELRTRPRRQFALTVALRNGGD
ncbi:PilW family protein [Massilia sp. TS11]|uniref:PilW family protein n=1 Tax=Massilia sp. TS11 TaxID=2908003 RepID=UPI001EDC9036|nr:PilW family protein [Massilia sp. TS11]MCG2586142.1 PilW family protein [Massilia sp. TS11]